VLQLIDTHAHLEEIDDLGPALAAAREAGVAAIIAVGSGYESNQRVLRLAEAHKGLVYPALGWHPWYIDAMELDRNLDFIREHIAEAVAVGEVGLDYQKRVRERTGKELQQYVLGEILAIAREHDKPAIIHSRYAWRDAYDVVIRAGLDRVVFHWYTGPSSVLRDILSRGYFISATPAVEYHDEHRRAVKEVPLDMLLLETDSPVVYRRGSELEYRAGPADVARSLHGAAALKGVSTEQVAGATTDNARRLFRL